MFINFLNFSGATHYHRRLFLSACQPTIFMTTFFQTRKRKVSAASLMLLSILSACSVHTPSQVELLPEVLQKVNAATAISADELTLSVDDKWWHNFSDPQLSTLIELALNNNPDLSASLSRVKSSQAGLAIASADVYPDLNLTTSASSDITELKKVNSASLGLSSSWELDLWGKISSLEEKAKWDLVTQQALFKAKANTVAGAITTAWIGWLAEMEKQRLFASQYKRTQTAYEVINRRFAMGKNSITDVWQQKRLIESIISQQAVNHARLASFEKQLQLWLGVSSNELPELLERSLPDVKPLGDFSLPLIGLQNRPDIQQAYARLQASNANLAAAVTEKFPRLSLRATYTTQQNSLADLFDDWSGNLVASIAMPIFNAGAIDAKVEQRQHSFEATYADYKQTWLDAIYAVENTMITASQLEQVNKQLDVQLLLAKKTERVVSLRYLNGKSTYLALLRAQETSLNLERQRVDAQRNLLNNRVQLYRELSHGNFSSEAPFSPIPFTSQPQTEVSVPQASTIKLNALFDLTLDLTLEKTS